MRRKDRRHTDEVELGNARRSERHLEAGELLAVLTDALGEKDLFRDVRGTHRPALGESPNRIVGHPQVCHRLPHLEAHSKRTSSSPASTACPGRTHTSATVPVRGAPISFSIFIASRTTSPWPRSTFAPASTRTATTLPGMAARTSRAPSPAVDRSRRRSARSSSSRSRWLTPPTTTWNSSPRLLTLTSAAACSIRSEKLP